MKISKLLEKISSAIVDSEDDIELSNDQIDQMLHSTITTEKSFSKLIQKEDLDISCKDCKFPKNGYKEPKESDFSKKQLSFINKSCIISELAYASIELLGFKPFRPLNLTILVKNYENDQESFCEINNMTVMGDPQLINFNGITDTSMRGNSVFFSKGFDISNRTVFGVSAGQGLLIDLSNPHKNKIKVEIILSGWETNSEHLGQLIFTNPNKILFSKTKCNKNSITKQIIPAGRYSALKSNYLQINSFNHNDKSVSNLEILDISVSKKSQIYSLEEDNSLTSSFFFELKPVNFDIFGHSKSKELVITFKNTNDYDIENYITLLGEPVDEDLIGQK